MDSGLFVVQFVRKFKLLSEMQGIAATVNAQSA
jgi:hypothetical protein